MKKRFLSVLAILLILQNVSFMHLEVASASTGELTTEFNAEEVVSLIAKIDDTDVYAVIQARDAYNSLSSIEKRKVENLKLLTAAETKHKAVLAVIKSIKGLTFKGNFAPLVLATDKSYKALSETQKELVNANPDVIGILEFKRPIAEVYSAIANLKITNKNLYEEVATIKANLEALEDSSVQYISNKSIYDNIIETLGKVEIAKSSIDSLDGSIESALAARKTLALVPLNAKNLVTNQAKLTNQETALKEVLAVISAIEVLNPDAKDFATKTKAAATAYKKYADKAGENNLVPVELQTKLMAYQLVENAITKITKLAATTATTKTAVKEARTALTETADNKKYVSPTLVTKLEKLETEIVNAEAVETLIGILVATEKPEGFDLIPAVSSTRAAYNGLTATEKKIVAPVTLKILTDQEKAQEAALKEVLAVTSAIEVLNPNAKDFVTKTKAAATAYKKYADKAGENNLVPVELQTKLMAYQLVENAITKITKLAATTATTKTAVKEARTALTETADNKKYVSPTLVTKLEKLETEIVNADAVERLIGILVATEKPEGFNLIPAVSSTRAAYNGLTATEKKIVAPATLKILTDQEKALKEVLVVTSAIEVLNPNAKDFVTKTKAAATAYKKYADKAGESNLVPAELQAKLMAYQLVENAITRITKLAATTATTKTAVKEARTALTETADNKKYVSPTLITKLEKLETEIVNAEAVETLIGILVATEKPEGFDLITAVSSTRAAYNGLTAAEKKIVAPSTLKILTDQEAALKEVLAVTASIKALNPDAKDFVTKTKAAATAYKKYADKAGENNLVPAELQTKLMAYQLVENAITKITNLAATTATNKNAVKDACTALTKTDDNKKYVSPTLVTKLEKLETEIVNAEAVETLIGTLVATEKPEGFDLITAVSSTRAAYNGLTAAEKKIVAPSTLKILTDQEAALKEVLAVISAIEVLNPDAKDFVTKTKAAATAYKKYADKAGENNLVPVELQTRLELYQALENAISWE